MIKAWFPTLIYFDILEEFKDRNLYLKNKAYSLKELNASKSSTNWKCDTFNTLDSYNYLNDNDTIINELVDVCKNRVLEFAKEYGVHRPISNLQCHDFWFNIASTGSYQEFHQHTQSHFSAVYYVNVNDNCGNINFRSIEAMTDMFNLPIADKDMTHASYKSCEYTPKESGLLIFRSNLLHMVEKNLSATDRISISMNFRFQ